MGIQVRRSRKRDCATVLGAACKGLQGFDPRNFQPLLGNDSRGQLRKLAQTCPGAQDPALLFIALSSCGRITELRYSLFHWKVNRRFLGQDAVCVCVRDRGTAPLYEHRLQSWSDRELVLLLDREWNAESEIRLDPISRNIDGSLSIWQTI